MKNGALDFALWKGSPVRPLLSKSAGQYKTGSAGDRGRGAAPFDDFPVLELSRRKAIR